MTWDYVVSFEENSLNHPLGNEIFDFSTSSHFTKYSIFHCFEWTIDGYVSSKGRLTIKVKTWQNDDCDYYRIQVKELINNVCIVSFHVAIKIEDCHVENLNNPLNNRNGYHNSIVPENIPLFKELIFEFYNLKKGPVAFFKNAFYWNPKALVLLSCQTFDHMDSW